MRETSIGTIRRARVAGAGAEMLPDPDGVYDIFLDGDRIADIAPTGILPSRGEVLDADGAWLIAGLWDHHVHVMQWSLVSERVPLGEARTAGHAARLMTEAPVLPDGRRVGTGYRDSFWPDQPSLAVLDQVTGNVPTYLINADVHSVWLNTAALLREGHEPDGIGILREEPAFEISRRLNLVDPTVGDTLVRRMAEAAAARGVVGIVDLDMAWNEDAWSRRVQSGFDLLRVEYGIYPKYLPRALAEGLRSGDCLPDVDSDLVRVGPVKVITDGSLGTRTAACSHAYPGDPHNHGVLTVPPAELLELVTAATGAGLRVALHAIGDVANSHALDVMAATGANGTIEHAQLVAHADIPRFARLGITASVQPEHAVDDRDAAEAIWINQTAQTYPLRSLAQAGVNLQFGSDAPVADLDPWAAMASAVFRTRDDRAPWRLEQAVDIGTALAASSHGGSRHGDRIEPGARADLALCAGDPRSAGERELRDMVVVATLLGGRVTYRE